MTIGANSYGSVLEVEQLTKRYTNSGVYDATTNPTLAAVEKFIDRVSALLNTILANYGFSIPVSQADAKLMLDEFTVEQVTQLCHGANGSGPFAPANPRLRNQTSFNIISGEASDFIDTHANGLEALGATRERGDMYGLQATILDDDGGTLQPPFDFDPHLEMMNDDDKWYYT